MNVAFQFLVGCLKFECVLVKKMLVFIPILLNYHQNLRSRKSILNHSATLQIPTMYLTTTHQFDYDCRNNCGDKDRARGYDHGAR